MGVISPYLKQWFKAFSCVVVVAVITITVIGISKIVGVKIKNKFLVQSQYHCSV
jgi:hypothetical protein